MTDLAQLRRDEFPWTAAGDIAYLNHASTGPLPSRTIRALTEWDNLRSTPWRHNATAQFTVLARSLVN